MAARSSRSAGAGTGGLMIVRSERPSSILRRAKPTWRKRTGASGSAATAARSAGRAHISGASLARASG
jgi:hypothetical protein